LEPLNLLNGLPVSKKKVVENSKHYSIHITLQELEEGTGIKEDSDFKPAVADIQQTRRKSVHIEPTKVFTVVTSSSMDVTTPAPNESWNLTTSQETKDDYPTFSTTADLETTENVNDIVLGEDSTTQTENYTIIPRSVSLVEENNDMSTIATLANVQEKVPTCYPPPYDPEISSSVLKPVSPVAPEDTPGRKQSEPVLSTSTTASNVQLEADEFGTPYRLVVQSFTSPSVLRQSAPFVKVSFVTAPPTIDFNKK